MWCYRVRMERLFWRIIRNDGVPDRHTDKTFGSKVHQRKDSDAVNPALGPTEDIVMDTGKLFSFSVVLASRWAIEGPNTMRNIEVDNVVKICWHYLVISVQYF